MRQQYLLTGKDFVKLFTKSERRVKVSQLGRIGKVFCEGPDTQIPEELRPA